MTERDTGTTADMPEGSRPEYVRYGEFVVRDPARIMFPTPPAPIMVDGLAPESSEEPRTQIASSAGEKMTEQNPGTHLHGFSPAPASAEQTACGLPVQGTWITSLQEYVDCPQCLAALAPPSQESHGARTGDLPHIGQYGAVSTESASAAPPDVPYIGQDAFARWLEREITPRALPEPRAIFAQVAEARILELHTRQALAEARAYAEQDIINGAGGSKELGANAEERARGRARGLTIGLQVHGAYQDALERWSFANSFLTRLEAERDALLFAMREAEWQVKP